jgi:uncharacterized membrane protein
MTFARFDEMARNTLGFFLWLAAVVLHMSAVLWVGFQGLKWLHDGYWTSQPTVMYWVSSIYPGASFLLNNPHSWYGAAKLALFLSALPSGLGLIFLGILCAVLSVSVADRRPEAHRVTKSRTAASF